MMMMMMMMVMQCILYNQDAILGQGIAAVR